MTIHVQRLDRPGNFETVQVHRSAVAAIAAGRRLASAEPEHAFRVFDPVNDNILRAPWELRTP